MPRKKGRRKSPFKLEIKKDTWLSIVSIGLWVTGFMILVSFTGEGVILSQVRAFFLNRFGVLPSLLTPFLFVSAGLMVSQVKWRSAKPNVFFGGVMLFVSVLGLFRSGQVGGDIFASIATLVNPLGAAVLMFAVGVVGLMIMSEAAIDEVINFLNRAVKRLFRLFHFKKSAGLDPNIKISGEEESTDFDDEDRLAHEQEQLVVSPDSSMPNQESSSREATPDGLTKVTKPMGSKVIWTPPPLSILSSGIGNRADRGDVKSNAQIIEDVFDSFGIKATVAEINRGPAVTQYAINIKRGTKLSKITSLQNDLALALAAPTGQIRVEAPIPGKSLVGIEIPNVSPAVVNLRTMLKSEQMKKNKSKLTVALGLNVSGQPVVADIASMPHVLIAGSTGSGKSVCLNAFLSSILFRASPDEVKFILVDPKRVELTNYNDIPHLLTPVIVEPDKVLSALKWAVAEMTRRYKVFAEAGVRNIEGFNELAGFQAEPYIVIVIDELADIMLFAPKEVEECVTKLAQMARATGIHLILATQRPSVDVLTGLIKANIPCRIAFNVTSMVDSRVIIDSQGAEKLLGRGDMLYIPPTQAKASRIQGTYVSDKEINAMIDHIKQSGVPVEYTEEITKKYQPGSPGTIGASSGEVDELFESAVRMVVQHKRASASLLQRYLSIGYSRAARIMDQLEANRVVSPTDGSSKPRQVLVKSADEFLARHNNN